MYIKKDLKIIEENKIYNVFSIEQVEDFYCRQRIFGWLGNGMYSDHCSSENNQVRYLFPDDILNPYEHIKRWSGKPHLYYYVGSFYIIKTKKINETEKYDVIYQFSHFNERLKIQTISKKFGL